LRIEELKRIQTFDDDYNLAGDFKEQWRQLGNAVPAKLAEVFAYQIYKIINK
jgi:DNA (cytosine-5)-methyltransferase 1